MTDGAIHSVDHRYGRHRYNAFDYYKGSTNGTPSGGRPWILIYPFSGYRQGSRESVKVASAIHSAFIDYIMSDSRPTPYEIFVCDVNQVEPRTVIGGEPAAIPERSMYFPETVALTQKCFQYIKSHPDRWTTGDLAGNQLNPDKGVMMGSSAGGTYAMLSGYMASAPFFTLGQNMSGMDRYPVTVSSKPAAVINRNGQVNWRPTILDPALLEAFVGIPAEQAQNTDRMPDAFFGMVSPFDYVNAQTPPTISVYDNVGGGAPPYTNPHDQSQGDDLKVALDAAGITNELYKDNPNGNTLDATNLARVYAFLQSVLGYP